MNPLFWRCAGNNWPVLFLSCFQRWADVCVNIFTNVKRENDICLCTHFDNKITPRVFTKVTTAKGAYALSHKNWIKSTLNQKADS